MAKVKTTIKDKAKAIIVHITAIACFVFIEISTILTSHIFKYYVGFSFSITLTAFSLDKYLCRNLLDIN